MFLVLFVLQSHKKRRCEGNKQSGCLPRNCSGRIYVLEVAVVVAIEHHQQWVNVVKFGKFNGTLMGTLSSKYLKWTVKNGVGEGEKSFRSSPIMGSSMMGSGFSDVPFAPVAKVPGWVVRDSSGWRKTNFSLVGTTKGGQVKSGVPFVHSEKKTSAQRTTNFGFMTKPIRIAMAPGSVRSPAPSSTVDDSSSLDNFFMEEEEFREQRMYNEEEITTDVRWLEGGQRVVYLESWQMKKMLAAANLGASCVNVQALAVEVGMDSSDVLAWLQNDTSSNTIILNNASENSSYMEDMHMKEDVEKPAVYVPPPPIPLRDENMREKVENLMYTLKDIISGPLADIIADEEKWKTTKNVFCESVEFQNPLFCLRGRDALFEWVQLLVRVGVVIKLHDIYYQNNVENPYHRWVYAAWTATLTNDLLKSVVELQLTDWWTRRHGQELVNSPDQYDKQKVAEQQLMNDRVLQQSGEWRFKMDESGQVTNVNTRWYKLAEQGGGQDFTDAKLWLSGLLRQKFC